MKPGIEDRWNELKNELMEEIEQWKMSHPNATFDQIEEILMERLGKLRARMLEAFAEDSDTRNLDEKKTE